MGRCSLRHLLGLDVHPANICQYGLSPNTIMSVTAAKSLHGLCRVADMAAYLVIQTLPQGPVFDQNAGVRCRWSPC